jgi:hypothetical protein
VGETLITAIEMSDAGAHYDVTWQYEAYREILAGIKDKIDARFALKKDPSSDQFEHNDVPAANIYGQLNTFSGPDIDWLVYSWIGNPSGGFCNMHITVHPGSHVDIPIFGLALAAFGGRPWGYADFLPRKELITNPDYCQKYYEPWSERWLNIKREHPELDWFHPPSAFIRAGLSPIAFLYSGPPQDEHTVDLIRQYANEYVDAWLALWDEPTAVPAGERAALQDHSVLIRRTIAELDPANPIAVKLFGEEKAEAMVRALWGGDRTLPHATGA